MTGTNLSSAGHLIHGLGMVKGRAADWNPEVNATCFSFFKFQTDICDAGPSPKRIKTKNQRKNKKNKVKIIKDNTLAMRVCNAAGFRVGLK